MKSMARPMSYPRELRERAIRMVAETKSEYPRMAVDGSTAAAIAG